MSLNLEAGEAEGFHATSRAGDPCPHDHVLLANVVEMLDDWGGWKAADTTVWREQLHAATAVGRMAGARVAVELGYAIAPDPGPSGRLGHWRIAGIPDEVLDVHSKRAAEIDAAVAERGYSSYRARNIAARDTREVKRHTPHVRGVIESMAETLAPATVRTNYAVLKAVMNAAVEADLVVKSPCRGVRLPSGKRRERATLTPEDLERLAAGMRQEYRPIVYVAGVLGLRWSEVAGLRVRHLDFLRRTLTVTDTVAEVSGRLLPATTKSPASRRTLAVPPFLMAMLAEHLASKGRPDPDDLVFAAPAGGLLRAANFRVRVWAPAVEAAGIGDLTFHGLRHAAASFMVGAGEHPRVIQHRLGHSTARLSLELYAHVSEAADRDAATHLDTLFTDAGDELAGSTSDQA